MAEQSNGMTSRIAVFITETKPSDIPDEVFEHAKIAFMDWLGVTLAGKDDPLVLKLIQYTDLLGGKEQATILGHGLKKSIAQAALINGAASHALDYDDTDMYFLGHPTVTLFPGLLSLGEFKGLSGEDLLTAYIVGLKAGKVIGAGAGNDHYMSGFHCTCTIGCLTSASACSLTRPDPGTTMALTRSFTRLPSMIAAAARRSSMRPLVQEPMKTRSISISVILVPAASPI